MTYYIKDDPMTPLSPQSGTINMTQVSNGGQGFFRLKTPNLQVHSQELSISSKSPMEYKLKFPIKQKLEYFFGKAQFKMYLLCDCYCSASTHLSTYKKPICSQYLAELNLFIQYLAKVNKDIV